MSSRIFGVVIFSVTACAANTPPTRAPDEAPQPSESPPSSDAAAASKAPARDGIRTTSSTHDFGTTLDRARSAIEARGLTLISEIDHGASAERVDLELRPTVLFVFGNPKVGTQVMAESQTAGIDLPLKLLVWQDESGAVHLTYNDPAWIFERHEVRGPSDILDRMRGALSSIAAEAAGQ